MHHMMMMGLHRGGAGGMMFGMVRRLAMKAVIVVLVLAVAFLWFRRNQNRW